MTVLVVVESPTKCKTIGKYLGKGYHVLASYGHVRDLLAKKGAVIPENNFEQHYELIERNKKHVKNIKDAVKNADEVLLAMDPDREGEAIAYHLKVILDEAKLLKKKSLKRIVFNEITKKAVHEAIAHPRELSMPLVQAQQARRILDYLVGFNLSPLLWKKIRPGLSAGRVQSPALILIVSREQEIEAFEVQEYWHLWAHMNHKKKAFDAKLTHYEGEKLTAHAVTHEAQAQIMLSFLNKRFKEGLPVLDVVKKIRKRNPSAPFTTSTLQQEASKQLGFSAKKTMRVAQQLYEGVHLNQSTGTQGLITYMRTDSVTLSEDAVKEIRNYIQEHYGKAMLPSSPNVYKTKAKNAQEAHEAIRPASILWHPDRVKEALSDEQAKLYDLIWRRTLACQMCHADLDTVQVFLGEKDKNVLKANGSVIKNPGFLSVYEDKVEQPDAPDQSDNHFLPEVAVGELLPVEAFTKTQHFTEPPPRYSEASLVKALEEHGIGRPSTYEPILGTLQQRGYVELLKKRFHPTDVGRVVAKFLAQYFTQYVDTSFTASLEDKLDAIASDEQPWMKVLEEFWYPFVQQIGTIQDTVQRSDVTQERMDENCPECSKPLAKRLGKQGSFVGCTGYPECRYTRPVDGAEAPEPLPEVDQACPKCEAPLEAKMGRFGPFLGCTAYPKCRHVAPLKPPENTGVRCPECQKGSLLARKSRYGKLFYSCEHYPDCTYAVWNEPLNEMCPSCRWPITTLKVTKRRGTEQVCPQKNCGHAVVVAPPEGKEKVDDNTEAAIPKKTAPVKKKTAKTQKASARKTTKQTAAPKKKAAAKKTTGTKKKEKD